MLMGRKVNPQSKADLQRTPPTRQMRKQAVTLKLKKVFTLGEGRKAKI